MSRDIDSIVAEYEESLRDGYATLSPNLTVAAQVERFRTMQERNHAVMEATGAVLRRLDVLPAWMLSYIGFALKVDKLQRNYSSRTLVEEVGLQVQLWTGRGLDREVLLLICREVFTLEIGAG